ncbi:prenyltransferase/squalene oxidase repeat-containing protein [Streptomyces sp. NPDC058812]|uniref:prenyltransferase/squalene oxidase repeat-containing protein n=1 Tax=unclassified Streptomyces TaxID=2593676 RepID=UPI0036A28F4F
MSSETLKKRVAEAVARGTEYLYTQQRADGGWTDRLSSSAMPTALAVLAFARAGRRTYREEIQDGLDWLRQNQREDGGWSVADADPPSDVSVTAFALAALKVLDPQGSQQAIDAGTAFIDAGGGDAAVFPNVRTWRELVAITWAMEGLRDVEQQPVQPLEIMLLPAGMRARASIALPGVVALGIGQSRQLPAGRARRTVQRLAEQKGLDWLRTAMATNGGIEECPLMAALVYTGLRVAGEDVGPDIQRGCLEYLKETRRADGSWAIDRDLELAVTSYAVLALAESTDVANEPRLRRTRDWLLSAQWNGPFEPLKLPAGGWSWANPSGWPESEDTAVVLTALSLLGLPHRHPAVRKALRWLYGMQNKDGSWSEWMRDSSMVHDGPCTGVTSHVVMGFHRLGIGRGPKSPVDKALRWFETTQQADGALPSLWFRDSTHGTAKVLETYAELGDVASTVPVRARAWLLENQRADGAWPEKAIEGAPDGGTAEETGWALYSLLRSDLPCWDERLVRAVEWLLDHQNDRGTWRQSMVGLYYDQLYYSDDLIAHTYAQRALARWLKLAGAQGPEAGSASA